MARAAHPLPQGRVQGGDLLILVLVGTHEQPFPRLVDVVAEAAQGREIVVQHGHTRPHTDPRIARWVEFLPYQELRTLIEAATSVVCHAGVGTIMTVLASGRTPVVVPRRKAFGEHVDDHQLQIARAFADKRFIEVAQSVDAVRAALERPLRAGYVRRPPLELLAAVVGAAGPREPRGPLAHHLVRVMPGRARRGSTAVVSDGPRTPSVRGR